MKNYMRNMREQIQIITNIQMFSGEIESIDQNFDVYVPLQH